MTYGDLSIELGEIERNLFQSLQKEALYLQIPFHNFVIDKIDLTINDGIPEKSL